MRVEYASRGLIGVLTPQANTTVEPCVLCAYAIRRTGVSRVVYGVPAGQAGGATSRYDILVDPDLTGWPAPPEIVAGVLAEECRALLKQPRRP